MKHAYLIIAHHNFEVLKYLVESLDDVRNDIFIHFDKKVKSIPELKTRYCKLYVLQDRIDVRWGHVSQIQTELKLLECAAKEEKYVYFHLISGTHLPLKNQEAIHEFFDHVNNLSLMSSLLDSEEEIERKLGYRHYFIRGCGSQNKFIKVMSNYAWRISLRVQKVSKKRVKGLYKGKYTNWASLTEKDVKGILELKQHILNKFRYSFCGDELYKAYAISLTGSEFIDCDTLLFQKFKMASPIFLGISDLKGIYNSNYLFARKISDNGIESIGKLLNNK